MSTPESGDPARGIPPQVAPVAQQVPNPGSATGIASPPAPPTPGIAGAAARVPGSPTLPDWDPNTLGRLIASAANELFTIPPGVSPFPAAMPSALSVPTPAPGAVPAPQVPTEAPSAAPISPPLSPFMAPIDFSAIAGPEAAAPYDLGDLRVPLVEETASMPSVPSPTAMPTEPAPPALSLEGLPLTLHELDPLSRPSPTTTASGFDAAAIRREFPILEERVNGNRLVWLDNAATTQKPRTVIERLKYFYEHENSNIHRAAHTLAARATEVYEGARESTRRFLNAPSNREIIFVRGATEGINLIANTWGRKNVRAGDEILITWLEHHANIVPWQMLCQATGAVLKVAPVDDTGQIILSEYERLLGPKTRLVSLSQVSNALGTVTPAKDMVAMAQRHGARVLVDGAQAVSHMAVDVQSLGCDFYVFSGHKVFAPTGIGAVFGKSEVLADMPPWQGGGNMIEDVTFEATRYQPPPARFEAGTGNIADAVGLGAALDWLSKIGLQRVEAHEHKLLVYGTERLSRIPGLTIIGTAAHKAGVLSFVLAGHETAAIASYLDQEGIAVRGGHHCAQPILRRFGVESTVRASFAPYNLCEDVDALADALLRLQARGR